MKDGTDELLEQAGVMLREDDPALIAGLDHLVSERVRSPRSTRRRRTATYAATVGVLLAVIGGGAVAASQWGPWRVVTEPDVVITRSWTDAEGMWLGDCATRIALEELPEAARSTARSYLASQDLDALEPNAESVAAALTSVGRPEDLPRLIPGADAADFDVHHTGELWSSDWFSDARILQDATTSSLVNGLTDALFTAHPELGNMGIESTWETQCTTDPTTAP